MGRIAIMAGIGGMLTGCLPGGAFHAASLTTVELAEPNHSVVATDVVGTA